MACAAWAAELLRLVKTIDNKAGQKESYIMVMVYRGISQNWESVGNDRFGLEIH